MLTKLHGLFFWCLIIPAAGCQSGATNNQSIATNVARAESSPTSRQGERAETKLVLDVPQFAGKSAAEVEKILGKPVTIKPVRGDSQKPSGEYRLYQTAAHPQGLSVHFYRDQATIFNLVLGTAAKSSRAALSDYFAIDVANVPPLEKTEFLEKWSGEFNHVNFVTVYAMKERIERDDYKLLHAEVAR